MPMAVFFPAIAPAAPTGPKDACIHRGTMFLRGGGGDSEEESSFPEEETPLDGSAEEGSRQSRSQNPLEREIAFSRSPVEGGNLSIEQFEAEAVPSEDDSSVEDDATYGRPKSHSQESSEEPAQEPAGERQALVEFKSGEDFTVDDAHGISPGFGSTDALKHGSHVHVPPPEMGVPIERSRGVPPAQTLQFRDTLQEESPRAQVEVKKRPTDMIRFTPSRLNADLMLRTPHIDGGKFSNVLLNDLLRQVGSSRGLAPRSGLQLYLSNQQELDPEFGPTFEFRSVPPGLTRSTTVASSSPRDGESVHPATAAPYPPPETESSEPTTVAPSFSQRQESVRPPAAEPSPPQAAESAQSTVAIPPSPLLQLLRYSPPSTLQRGERASSVETVVWRGNEDPSSPGSSRSATPTLYPYGATERGHSPDVAPSSSQESERGRSAASAPQPRTGSVIYRGEVERPRLETPRPSAYSLQVAERGRTAASDPQPRTGSVIYRGEVERPRLETPRASAQGATGSNESVAISLPLSPSEGSPPSTSAEGQEGGSEPVEPSEAVVDETLRPSSQGTTGNAQSSSVTPSSSHSEASESSRCAEKQDTGSEAVETPENAVEEVRLRDQSTSSISQAGHTIRQRRGRRQSNNFSASARVEDVQEPEAQEEQEEEEIEPIDVVDMIGEFEIDLELEPLDVVWHAYRVTVHVWAIAVGILLRMFLTRVWEFLGPGRQYE